VSEIQYNKFDIFAKWIKNNNILKFNRIVEIIKVLLELNVLSLQQNYLQKQLSEIDSIEEIEALRYKLRQNETYIEKNKINKGIFEYTLKLYINFLKQSNLNSLENNVKDSKYYLRKILLSDIEKQYKHILNKYFHKGFKINSIINNNKFKEFYEKEYLGKELVFDANFNTIILKICINCTDNLLMTPSVLIKDISLLEDILNFVLTSFEEGKKVVYYDGIYNIFKYKLIDTNIYNSSILKGLLIYYLKEDFYFNKNYLATSKNIEINPSEEIEQILLENNSPMDKESIIEKLPHISKDNFSSIIKDNRKIIYVQKNVYWHIDKFDFSEDDKIVISDIIKYEIKDGFISIKKLIEKLKLSDSDFIEKNCIANNVYNTIFFNKIGVA